ncbi:MAG: AsmA-like C-terminal region-containing protein, partial [Hyphomicrobiales bacterium]
KGTAAIPMTLKLEAPALTAALDGRTAVASGLQFAGQIDLNVTDIVKFGRWMGLLLPEGGDAWQFSVSGKFDWDRELIGFDEGSFSIDGNRAIGALSLKLGPSRPQVEGTLAFQKLALPALQFNDVKPDTLSTGVPDGFTWMHHVDVDLRISTASLVSPALEIGQAAISAVLRSGQLDGDFAILDLCEGRANGRFEYNAGVPEGRARLAANINGLSARRCLAAIAGASPLRGATDIEVDVTTQGRDMTALVRKAKGQVKLRLTEGEVDIDVAKLAALAPNGEVSGWEPLRGRTTAISSMEGTILLRPGIAYSDSVKLVTADRMEISGDGSIDLSTWNVDYRLAVANGAPASPPAAGATEAKGPARLVISGPLSKPVFQIAPVRSGSHAPGAPRHYAAHGE